MAKSGTINGTPASNGNYLYIEWKETSIDTANNTSTVEATLKFYNPYGSYSSSACPWSLTINGVTTSGSTAFSGSVTLGSGTTKVKHGSDGKKSITISASFDTQGTSTGVISASGTAVLSDIGTKPTCKQSLESKTATSITMKWSSDSTIDHYWYSTDNGSTWHGKDITGAKSGSYTITGLKANTTYKVITSVRKKGTSLWTNSSMLSVTTYGYPTSTQSLSSKTDKTITMKWASDQTIDYIWYSTNNGSTWHGVDVTNGKSGTYTIKSLSASTTYKIKTRVRAKDSKLTKDSSALSVKTYPANYFTFTLSKKGSSTVSSFKVLAVTNNTQVASNIKEYSIKWTHYPSGKPKEAITANSNNVATSNSEITRTFSNLLPNTEYTVQAVLYKGTVTSGTVVFTKSITVKTADIGGTFNYTARSSSVINMALNGVAKLPYNTRVKLSYKNSNKTKWVLKSTTDFSANEAITSSFMFTGLLQNNTYNFKAEVYKVDGTKTTLLKTYTKDVSTTVFVPDADEVMPDIPEIINVPHVCKALIKLKTDQALKGNTSAVLYESSDGETYTALQTIASGDENAIDTWSVPISGTVGTSMWYKFVIEDANQVQHNTTEPVEIEFKDVTWRNRARGEALDIEADNIKEWANALLELYRYDKAIGQTGTQHDIYDKNRFYDMLLSLMDTISEGLPIVGERGTFAHPDGSALQVMEYLAVAFIEASTGSEHYPIGVDSGQEIVSININTLFNDLRTALETIM